MHAVLSSSFWRSLSFIVGVESVAIEPPHRIDDFLELPARKLGINGKRDDFTRCLFALGKSAIGISEISEARLEVKRERIVDGISYPPLLQMLLKSVTPLGAKCVLVVDGDVRGIDGGSANTIEIRERSVIERCIATARGTPAFEMRQFREKHCRLESVQSAVVTDLVVMIRLHPAVYAEPPKPHRKVFILCHHHPAVAESAEIL